MTVNEEDWPEADLADDMSFDTLLKAAIILFIFRCELNLPDVFKKAGMQQLEWAEYELQRTSADRRIIHGRKTSDLREMHYKVLTGSLAAFWHHIRGV